ncbi:MAG: helix-turn-helix domain-containing protein [Sphaerochaetaceae bacterium]
MSFSEELKSIRQHSFLSQEAFARELNVSFSSVNRWEGGRAKPNLNAMKNIKAFCETHDIDFSNLEREWYEMGKEY